MDNRLRVGVITTTHGIKGEVKVFPTTDDVNRFKELKGCFLVKDGREIPVTCESCKFFKNMVILKFKEFNNINQVEGYRNYDILVDRENAVELSEDEFFLCDIMDADVYDQDNKLVGRLTDILETPASHILVINDIHDKELLVPLVKEWVTDVDTDNRIVRIVMHNESVCD
mgnify:FL=1